MIEIPWRELSAEALAGLIEEYVTRDGTDYGEREIDFATRVAQVRRELEAGRARVVYDAETGTANIVVCD